MANVEAHPRGVVFVIRVESAIAGILWPGCLCLLAHAQGV